MTHGRGRPFRFFLLSKEEIYRNRETVVEVEASNKPQSVRHGVSDKAS
jgi:hypothetical protein